MDVIDRLDGATRLFPIIGDPVTYVESPARLTRTFAGRGHNGICVPLQVSDRGPRHGHGGSDRSRGMWTGSWSRCRTSSAAFAYCATSSERARLLGVVSVIRRNADGSWHGDMLDGLAFVKAQQDHGAQTDGARALLVGAGGAGSAIAIALLEAGSGVGHP